MRVTIGILMSCLLAGGAAAQPINLHPVPPSGQNPELPNLLLEMPGDTPQAAMPHPTPGVIYSLQMEGQVMSVGSKELAMSRGPGATEAFVSVDEDTVFTYRGEPVTFDQIPEGAEVRVVFNLDHAEPVATQVDAAPHGQQVPVDPTAPPFSPELPGTAGGTLAPLRR